MTTIEASMIVKNEESCLEKCLQSLKGIDLITIIDTGSKDKTIEIAKKYTDKVYYGEEYNWRDDFAYSRNQSLEKCTGDWIVIIDADEVLEPNAIPRLKEIIEKNPNETGITLQVWNNQGHYFDGVRVFKRTKEAKWFGRVHNHLNVYEDNSYKSNIKLTFSTSLSHNLDPNRQLRILQLVIRENPKVSREKYYLGIEYFDRYEYDLAIYYLEWYLETSNYPAEMTDAILTLAYAYNNIGNYDKAKEYCLRAIGMNPSFKEAIKLLEELSGPNSSKIWRKFKKEANNDGVFIIREF